MIVKSQHKRLDLAERHAARLARQNPGSEVRIISRRNDSGRFAANGRNFTFEIKPPEPPEPPKKEIGSLQEFFDAYDAAEDFDNYDIDGGVDYGEQE